MAVCNQKLIDCIKALDTAGYIYVKSPHKCPTDYQTIAPFLKGSLCSKGSVIPLGQISAYTTYVACISSNGTPSPAPSSMSSYAPAPRSSYAPAPRSSYAPAPGTSYAPAPVTSYAPAPVTSYAPAPAVSPWILVFSHRTSSAGSQTSQYFANANEVMNIMGDPSTPVHKLSILNTLENYRMNGIFHFKLIYPNLPEPNYIEWTQANNPTNTSTITNSVIITNPYNGTGCPGWGGGLYKNDNNTNTFIQGDSNKGCWFFPVGVYNSSYGGNGYFPGPSGPPVDWVQLYVYYTPPPKNNTVPAMSPSPMSSYAPAPRSSYAPAPGTSYAPAPVRSYAPAPVTSYAPAPVTSYAPAPSTSYAPAPGKLYASVPSNTIVSAPTPIYSSIQVKVPDQVPVPVKVPDQIQPSSKDINTQVSKDPFPIIYKDQLDDDQVETQPIKYMSDTLANCKIECSKNDQCVGVSRHTDDLTIPDVNDVVGDCTLLQSPYNLADYGVDSGWTTYTRK